MITIRLQLIVIALTLLLSGCGNDHSSTSTDTDTNANISSSNASNSITPKYFALLGPISDANVTIFNFDTNKQIFTTKTKTNSNSLNTLKWGEYNVGSFEVDINKSVQKQTWLKLEITSGKDIDSDDDGNVNTNEVNLNGKIKLLCKVEDLNSRLIIANIFTTLGVEFYLHEKNRDTLDIKTYLDDFAKSIFSKSIDNNKGIDYRDLFAYIPNYTSNKSLKTTTLYKNLLKYKIIDDLLQGKEIISSLKKDDDLDGLSLWQEILHNTSPTLADTDADGINDNDELKVGLNPTLKDSDYDGINDDDEKLYGTSALNPDSDEDYIPDGIEIKNATDPLNADEDGNGIKDGLDGDPFFKYQWYIKSLGNIVANTANEKTVIGNDLNILNVYHKVLGNHNSHNTIIQVVDTGVELKHKDLNIYLDDSFNAITKGNDPTATGDVSRSDPTSPLDTGHGTAVAGILAAKTNNNIGIRGLVPRAKIAGSNWLEDQSLAELDRVWFSQINDDNITVCNNSWGTYYLKDTSFERILALGTSQLRYGKGRIYVFAAGNDRETYGNSNLSYLTNNPYVISVASLNAQDKYASYSNPGSNILVSGYGGEHYYTAPTIMTTSLSGYSYYEYELNDEKGVITVDEDTDRSYTYAMNGTSAASPMVSASIALVLDACPSLTWRDIRWLIANTATKVDYKNEQWLINGAGLHFNVNYGYGKINPSKMIDMCRSMSFESLPKMQHDKVTYNYDEEIPDNNTTLTKTISFKTNMKVEWIGLTLDTTHPFAGDLEVNLISPMGTKINIISPAELKFAAYDGGFRFSSVGYIDEDSKGDWQVQITDRLENDSGILKSLSLEVYGYE